MPPAPVHPFPLASSAVLGLVLVALGVLSHIATHYCAFGFGGFQCNQPFLGVGDWVMLLVVLGFCVGLPMALGVWACRMWRWWRARRS